MAVTRTVAVPNPVAVPVRTSAGEYLHITITARGPVPIFSFASSHKGILYEAADFLGHPKAVYEWEHLRNPSDIQQLDLLDFGMVFISNANYRYVVERRSLGGAIVTVMDITFAGAPTDDASESFRVVIQ